MCDRDIRHVTDDVVDCDADDGDVATVTGAATRCGGRAAGWLQWFSADDE